MKLTAHEQAEFAAAVRSAARRPEVLPAVEALYEHLHNAIELRQPICSASGRCCRFEEYGHRLFITALEMAAFVARLGSALDLAGWDGAGCVFQVGGMCGVHRIRPFGCRVFFCDPTSDQWQSQQYEWTHARLKEMHESLGVPYRYVEWREALRALSGQAAQPA